MTRRLRLGLTGLLFAMVLSGTAAFQETVSRAAEWRQERIEKAAALETPRPGLVEGALIHVEAWVDDGFLGWTHLGVAVYEWLLLAAAAAVVLVLVRRVRRRTRPRTAGPADAT